MKLYYGGYGHHPSGKQYVYWGDDNYRIGENVNVPVTNWKTGKTYNTMFTIQNTRDKTADAEAMAIEEQGINIKTINGSNVMTLPSAYEFSSKADWSRTSDEEFAEKLTRLAAYNETNDTTEAQERLMRSEFSRKVPINAQYSQSVMNRYNPARALRGQSVQQLKTKPIETNKPYNPNNVDFTKKMF